MSVAAASSIGLLISDVDGTLVTPDKKLTEGTVAAVRLLTEAGLPFTVISARPPSGLTKIRDTLAIHYPMAAFNGGTLITAAGAVVEAHRIDAEVVGNAFALADGSGATPWVFAGGRWYVRDLANSHVPRERIASGQEPVVLVDMSGLFGNTDKLTWVSDDPARLRNLHARMQASFGQRATISQSQTYFLDITHPFANKGHGIVALAKAVGVPLEQVAVIGDMPNDVPMFERAGLSIAMGQAPEDVRSRAHFVTSSNEEDGVAKAIETIILPSFRRAQTDERAGQESG